MCSPVSESQRRVICFLLNLNVCGAIVNRENFFTRSLCDTAHLAEGMFTPV
jgi:hypothetical protein